MVIGEPYLLDGTTYTPADTLNYDEVGYVALDNSGSGITAAHHTLPLPSYAEVTSLETGRTILVRVDRRGPMDSHHLIALSAAAAAQLGITTDTPVRVRRVNPPEMERAALRLGMKAPERLETPSGLLAVLRRKLPATGSASLAYARPTATAGLSNASNLPDEEAPAVVPTPNTGSTPTAVPTPEPTRAVAETSPKPKPAPKPTTQTAPPVTPSGNFVVQAGAFSTADRADRVAKAIGGSVSKSGNLFRVRTGPFATRAQAEASLAKVRASGYSDARIFTKS